MNTVFEGLKVLDFSRVMAAPIATEYLAAHGATVIRIESSKSPDPLRISMPYFLREPGINRSGYFNAFNANKLSLGIDLDHPKSKNLIHRLVKWCDIGVENFVPGTLQRKKLGYLELSEIKPDLILLSSSSQGNTGPLAHVSGYGYSLNALCGFTNLTGWDDRNPCNPFGAFTDYIAPYVSSIALIAALEYRRQTGKGQHIDVSQYECGVDLLAPIFLDYFINNHEPIRSGNCNNYCVPHGAYQCKGDDKWCVISIESEKDWFNICQILSKGNLINDERFNTFEKRKKHEDTLDRIVGDWTSTKTAEEIISALQEAGIASGKCLNPEEIFNDPQLRHRGHFVKLDCPDIGSQSYEMPAFRLSLTPAKLNIAAPRLGQHSEYICREILEIPEDEFINLLFEGVIEVS